MIVERRLKEQRFGQGPLAKSVRPLHVVVFVSSEFDTSSNSCISKNILKSSQVVDYGCAFLTHATGSGVQDTKGNLKSTVPVMTVTVTRENILRPGFMDSCKQSDLMTPLYAHF